MVIVTGGAGFIGSYLARMLEHQTNEDIIIVDDLSDGKKFSNISDIKICDYLDRKEFLKSINKNDNFLENIKCVFHQGACTDTTEWDGNYMMNNNYTFSKILLKACLQKNVRFIYASSAAVYGSSDKFNEHENNESPLNVYGYSKLLFDQYVRKLSLSKNNQVVGLRYFNVYGPGEEHKGKMASVVYHFNQQILDHGIANLFKGSHGFEDGEQLRDFIFVKDIAEVNLWFYQNSQISGIFNLGTGISNSFNQIAREIINWHGKGKINYIDFPENLKGTYQAETKADMGNLRKIGYSKKFTDIHNGIKQYLNSLVE
mgnify:FL=1